MAITPEQQREKERQRDKAECDQDREELFIHTMPKADACDHVWSDDHRDLPDGNGAESYCTKCGMGSLQYSLLKDR